ncbi:type II toxin-antitoxin system Phd/YefM family antitoxin [Gymnodinialimonas ulvae]|uniref:type II toxin-antitoxin system Phd/YefM family antitoxin n=1 Tax=Gymnodinialimonas ulvae TaxID=3126504 RepID=UPI0030AF2CB0
MQASVHEAKTNLSKLLEAVARGERVVITKHGKPAAELVPPKRGGVVFGSLAGKVDPKVVDAFIDALEEPMSEEELRLWEGG